LGDSEKVPTTTGNQMRSHFAAGASNRGIGRAAEQNNRLRNRGKSTWKRAKACCLPPFNAKPPTNTQPNPHTPNKRTQTRKPQPQTPTNPTTQSNTRTISRGAIVFSAQQFRLAVSLVNGTVSARTVTWVFCRISGCVAAPNSISAHTTLMLWFLKALCCAVVALAQE
jgi:hypothetical protein